uniref:Chromo domain-containing protein n=1 Tax=Heterorhabditis bacteriophora TaxID=37862 RepID=A0A1I7X744_HETBA
MLNTETSSSTNSLSLSKNKLAQELKFNELKLILMGKINPFCEKYGYDPKAVCSAVRRLLKIADQRDPTSNDHSRVSEQFGVQRSHLKKAFTIYKELRAETYQKAKLGEQQDEKKDNLSVVTLNSDSGCSLLSEVNNGQDEDNDEDEQSEYEVAEVDGIRGGYRYHVIWKGYENGGEDWSDSENWVHEDDMNCQALIDEFNERERLHKIERKKKLAEQAERLREKKRLEEKKKWENDIVHHSVFEDYFTSGSVSETTSNDDDVKTVSRKKKKMSNPKVSPSNTIHEILNSNLYKYLSKGMDGFEKGYEVVKVIAVVRKPMRNASEGVVLFKLPNGKAFAQIFPLKYIMDNAYNELVRYFKQAKSPESMLIRYLAKKSKMSDMPMDPMDVMWMSKAPTVSEVVGKSNVTFKGVVAPPAEDGIRPDFDTDVLWKPPRLSQKSRTVSVDSTDSEGARKLSISESSPIDVPRPRRMSITEMIFGSPAGGFSWSQGGLQASSMEVDRKSSVTEVIPIRCTVQGADETPEQNPRRWYKLVVV